mgnify:CR=1 FL=1
MAAKKTSDIIPFCHQLPLDGCDIKIQLQGNNVIVDTKVETHNKTGVEMEALVAASVASLTIYDMCKVWLRNFAKCACLISLKALSHDIKILDTSLISKTGGKNSKLSE